MQKSLVRKGLVLGVIVLFVGASVIPSMGRTTIEKQDSIDNRTHSMGFGSRGDILYVGGSGPGNYSSIQAAINAANNGDTVFVYDDSSPYFENVIIDESINLIGENKETTVINGGGSGDFVYISANGVSISGFTVQNCGSTSNAVGIELNNVQSCNIENNKINSNNGDGIEVFHSNSNTISNNIITLATTT